MANIIIPEVKANERYYLRIEYLESVLSEIEINNRKTGFISWKPYMIDVTVFVWTGENRVSISLTNSLRNLLGEIHFIPREMEGDEFTSQWSLKVTPRLADGPNWYENRENLITWSDDYFFRPFGIGEKWSYHVKRSAEFS